MTLDELIAQMTNPQEFTRLCNAVFADIYGRDFQVIDGSRSDNGNDGYIASEKRMLAMHCPVKPEQRKDADYLQKIHSDLRKAVKLKGNGTYAISEWTFVTPRKLSDHVIAEMRSTAKTHGILASHQESTFLANELQRREHLLQSFPTLEALSLRSMLKEVLELVRHNGQKPVEAHPVSPTKTFPRDQADEAALEEFASGTPSEESKVKLKALIYRTVDPFVEINAIILLCRWYEPGNDTLDELQMFVDRGLQRAGQVGHDGSVAQFHAQKAAFLAMQVSLSLVEQHFSTQMLNKFGLGASPLGVEERKRIEHSFKLAKDFDDSTQKAVSIMRVSPDADAVSAGLVLLGVATGQLAHAYRAIGATVLAGQALERCKTLLQAAKETAASMGDELGAANATFNLANQIRWHGQEREALVLVKSTIPIALKFDDTLLGQKALWLQKTIETGEIPDYLNGERRDWTAL